MAKISKMIDDLTGKTKEEQKMKEQFTFLQKMAEAQTEVFKNELKLMLSSDSLDKVEIVGKRAFKYYSSQHVGISRDCDKAIASAVDDFFSGKDGVKLGFQKLVKQALSGIIGNSSLGESKEDLFFIYPENFAVVRVDVKCYKYNFSSKDIFANNVQNVFCYTMAKSIVDHTKLTIDELLYMVTDMVGSDDIKVISEFINTLKEVWRALERKEPNAVLTAALES